MIVFLNIFTQFYQSNKKLLQPPLVCKIFWSASFPNPTVVRFNFHIKEIFGFHIRIHNAQKMLNKSCNISMRINHIFSFFPIILCTATLYLNSDTY